MLGNIGKLALVSAALEVGIKEYDLLWVSQRSAGSRGGVCNLRLQKETDVTTDKTKLSSQTGVKRQNYPS